MELTEIRIKLIELSDDRLQAFCSITIDNCFVIRDLKIIEGPSGPFVAMPSRKIMAHCPRCRTKNHVRAAFCNQCGVKLHNPEWGRNVEQRGKLYADIAHPINSEAREMLQRAVIEGFHLEKQKSKQPGYRSSYDDIDEDALASEHASAVGSPTAGGSSMRADARHKHSQPPPHPRPSSSANSIEGRIEEGDDFGAGIL
jgi:stage V sporulation protein G